MPDLWKKGAGARSLNVSCDDVSALFDFSASFMSENGLKYALERFGLRQVEFARLLEVSPRTVSQWATGTSEIPGPVAAYLRLLGNSGPAGVAGELSRLKGRSHMLDEGLYGLSYRAEKASEPAGGDALAVLRNGKILGSDRWGGVFAGSYTYDAAGKQNRVHVRFDMPPDGTLVTGYCAGPSGATLDIVADFQRATPVSHAVVDVAGQPVAIELTYIGPLPK